MNTNISLEDLIIEMMPFADKLKAFCSKYPNFKNALKIIYTERFITLQAISTSYSPNYPNDEVIGIYVYDYGLKHPIFKQDFIVNKNGTGNQFVVYTGLGSVVDGKQIKHINEFINTYGKGGHYKDAHHPKYADFTGELKYRADRAIKIGEERIKKGNPPITNEKVQEVYRQYIDLKNTSPKILR